MTKDVCTVWAFCLALPCRGTNKLHDKTTCKGEKGKTKLCATLQDILCRSRACFRTRHCRRGVFGTYIPHKNKHTSCTEENYEQNACKTKKRNGKRRDFGNILRCADVCAVCHHNGTCGKPHCGKNYLRRRSQTGENAGVFLPYGQGEKGRNGNMVRGQCKERQLQLRRTKRRFCLHLRQNGQQHREGCCRQIQPKRYR